MLYDYGNLQMLAEGKERMESGNGRSIIAHIKIVKAVHLD
jgi:hypothetical protein